MMLEPFRCRLDSIPALVCFAAWSSSVQMAPASVPSQELRVQDKALEEAGPLAYALSVSVALGLSNESLVVACEHGDVVEDPGARGIARVGDRIDVEWASIHLDRAVAERGDGIDRFARRWRKLEVVLNRHGAQVLEPEAVHLVSPLVEQEVLFEWDEARSAFVAAAAQGNTEAEVLSTSHGGLPIVDALDGLSFTGNEVTSIDPGAFWCSLWPGGFGRLGYGERGSEMVRWPSAHIAILPELPPRPEVWMEGVEGEIRGRLAERDAAALWDAVEIELDLDLRGSAPVDRWLLELLAEQGITDDYVDMLGHFGRGLRWRYVAKGCMDGSTAQRRITRASIEGKLAVSYELEYCYSWDSPSIEEFHGKLAEAWDGDLRIDLTCGVPAVQDSGGK